MRRCTHLIDPPTHAAAGDVITVPPGALRVALQLAEGDRRRIVVRPSPEAIGGGCIVVTNRPRGEM